MRRLRSANSTEAARLLSGPTLRTSHLRSTTWTSSPNTLPQKVIHCRTDHIRRTAEELPSLTHRKATRSNLSSELRNNILHVILLERQGPKACSAGTCAGDCFVHNFPSMIWRNRIWFLCALFLTSALSSSAQDGVDSNIVRPSGINGPVRKAKAVTQKSSDDETESDAPKAK